MEGLLLGKGAFLVMCFYLLVASTAATSSNKPRACPGAARPVCGRDGFTYYNPCVAAYNGVLLAGHGACPGDPQRFVPAIRGTTSSRAQQPGQQGAAAGAPALLLPDILDAYKQQGFAYVGRVAMAAQPSLTRQANPPAPASAAALGAAAWFEARRPAGLWAARCTSAGDVYVARFAPPSGAVSKPRSSGKKVVVTEELAGPAIQQQQQRQQRRQKQQDKRAVLQVADQQLDAADESTPRRSPLAAALRRFFQLASPPLWWAAKGRQAAPSTPQASRHGEPCAAPCPASSRQPHPACSSGSRSAPTQAPPPAGPPPPLRRPPHTRRLATILAGDQRAPCKGVPPAVGMLQFSLASSRYVCTGVLFAPGKVLTAGHCVYDSATHSYVTGLTFTPGQAMAANGTWQAPHGVLAASAVTVFKNYLDSDTSAAGDLAVVHLAGGGAPRAGLLPLGSAGCGGRQPVQLTTAGYPVDKPLGGCWQDACSVTLDCATRVSRHTCDTALGQSGSPLWDGEGRVRAVHVRGDETYNEAITLTEAIVKAINAW